MLNVETIADDERLRSHTAEWTELAETCDHPYSLPGWALAWWRNARPQEALLRAVLVRDGEALVGVAPFYAEGHRYRLLAAPLCEPVEPLAARGREEEVATAIAAELAGLEPRLRTIDFGPQWSTGDWAARLRDAWPGSRRPWTSSFGAVSVHVVPIDGLDLEGWLQARDSKQRSNLRRYRRRLDEAGAVFRLATLDTLERDVASFLSLHVARRSEDETALAMPEIAPMLIEAGHELIPRGQLRLICLDLDGETIAARVMLAVGGEVTGWNSGFDNTFSKLSPSLNTFMEGLSIAIEAGDRSVDFGPDTADYKRRLADAEKTLVSRVFLTRGRGYLRARVRLALRLGS